jgi:hypothetical protein
MHSEKVKALLSYKKQITIAVLTTITLAALCVHIAMYVKVRTLHLDEAMFAESILTRNLTSLTASPLLNDQTAPILYLYTVKIITLVFGQSEAALRVFSLITFFGILAALALLLKQIYHKGALAVCFCLCVVSTIGIYMRYSDELKPYMSDAFFVLASLLVYHFYQSGKLRLPAVTLLFCVMILYSNPVLFFIAAAYFYEFASAIIAKDKKKTIAIFLSGLITLACFVMYYILWLMPVAESGYMIDFWKDHRFYLLPLTKAQLVNNILNATRIFRPLGLLFFGYAVLFPAGIAVSFRERTSRIILIAAALLLIASNMDKWPVEPRLYMFIYALIAFYSTIALASLTKFRRLKYAAFIMGFFLIVNNAGFYRYAVDALYVDGHEVNPLIAYVRANIREGEYLYCSNAASFVLKYKNGYDNARIGDVSYNNIIFSGDNDGEKIVDAQKAYLLFQRSPSQALLKELESNDRGGGDIFIRFVRITKPTSTIFPPMPETRN